MTETFKAEQQIIDHCRVVAKVATALGRAIRQAGTEVDLDLIAAAGLLHDLAKKQADHARRAEQILSAIGYPAVADIVGCHMDIALDKEFTLGEKEVVYLADKLVRGNRIIDLAVRFKPKIRQYKCDPHTVSIIKNRLGNALTIQHRLEQLTRRSLESIIERPSAEPCR
jgi:molybdenum cofactor cytidylyltransferase